MIKIMFVCHGNGRYSLDAQEHGIILQNMVGISRGYYQITTNDFHFLDPIIEIKQGLFRVILRLERSLVFYTIQRAFKNYLNDLIF